MSKIKSTIWKIEPHTKAKHEILRRYLGAWFGILGRTNPKVLFIDGFAGPGRYIEGEIGSPIIAADIALHHINKQTLQKAVLVFIEEDEDRIEYLKREISDKGYPEQITPIFIHNEFEGTISELLDDLQKKGQSLLPSFVFIDPFGFKGLPFALVSRLLKNPRTEVFINIMTEFVNRFLEHPDVMIRKQIVELFGTEEVLDIVDGEGDRAKELQRLYFRQLSKNAKYIRYFEMRDKDNKILYTLFFATNSLLGYVRMKEALWKVDDQTGISFSDATNPNQAVLLKLDPTDDLVKLVMDEFSGQTIDKREIRLFIESETPYIGKQLNVALLRMEIGGTLCVEPCKTDGKNRRKRSFPDDCRIKVGK